MMYIGTSLGGCLRSILLGEVSEDEVIFIISRTDAPTIDLYMKVVAQYHERGNPYSRNSGRYELSDYTLEEVSALATRLWYSGKIHQPRIYAGKTGMGYVHPTAFDDSIWLHISPVNRNTSPSVVEAWEKYKLLDALTK